MFDEQDRTAIVSELSASLIQDNAYLLDHPTIRAIHLARFVPASMLPQLRNAVESTNDVEAVGTRRSCLRLMATGPCRTGCLIWPLT